jgi:hypothetical protein
LLFHSPIILPFLFLCQYVYCRVSKLDIGSGSIYYTGGIEGKILNFETRFGNINIELEGRSDVDVDIQSSYSYRQHPRPVMSVVGTEYALSGGWEKAGYATGRITNKKGSGIINAVTRGGKINCNVSY